MGRYVNGRWRDDLIDPGGGGEQGNTIPVGPGANGGGGGGGTSNAGGGSGGVPPPAGMPNTSLGNTNDQSQRAALRGMGYFIDDSGVYAPGSGQRVGSTWQGDQSGRNTIPSSNQLPIINGTPVSPSNGWTGPNTGAIMYRGDPQYQALFGQGTPGQSAAPTPWAPGQRAQWNGQDPNGYLSGVPATGIPQNTGQQSLADWNAQQAPRPAPATNSTSTSVPSPAQPAPGQPSSPSADQAVWQAGVAAPNPNGPGFGPYATAEPPSLTVQGRYTDNGKVIEKSVDQFGHEYYQSVGSADAPQPSTSQPDTQGPKQDAGPTINPSGNPPKPGEEMISIMLPDGSGLAQIPAAQAESMKRTFDKIREDQRQSKEFKQGIEQGQLDNSRAVTAGTQAYQKALIEGNAATLAASIARDVMHNDIEKQTIELNKIIAGQTAVYQQGQLQNARDAQASQNVIEQQKLEAQRQASAQGNATEQDKLSLQRQTARGRRLPQVRYR